MCTTANDDNPVSKQFNITPTKNTVVVLVAIEHTNTALIKCCLELLKIKRLASYHFHLTGVTEDEEILMNLVSLREMHHRLFFHNTDVRCDESVRNTVQTVARMEGKIDILVCHIENRTNASAARTTPHIVRNVFDGNFYPNLRFITEVVAQIKIQNSKKAGGSEGGTDNVRGGKIIVMNSYAGMQGISHSSTYCASRFALNGFIQSVAAETLASKIRFCTLQTVLQKLPLSLLSNDVADCEILTNEDRDLIQSIDENLEQQKLLQTFSIPKLANCLKTLFTATEFPDLRNFTSDANKHAARAKFMDPKGLNTLSTTVQFYLNLDLDEFLEERNKRRRFPSLGLLKKTSHFKCTSTAIVK